MLGGQKVLLNAAAGELGFFSFRRKLKKDSEYPVNLVK
jgi:hypothetical protein